MSRAARVASVGAAAGKRASKRKKIVTKPLPEPKKGKVGGRIKKRKVETPAQRRKREGIKVKR